METAAIVLIIAAGVFQLWWVLDDILIELRKNRVPNQELIDLTTEMIDQNKQIIDQKQLMINQNNLIIKQEEIKK